MALTLRKLTIEPLPKPEWGPGDVSRIRGYAALPSYPKFGSTVTRYHKLPRTPENIAAHAEALFAQLRSLQRREASYGTPDNPKASCVSGTWLTDGNAICAAIRRRHASALAGALEAEHKARTDRQVGAALKAMLAGEEVGLVSTMPR